MARLALPHLLEKAHTGMGDAHEEIHLLEKAHTGMGDAHEEIKPNLVGDVRPVAARMTSSRTCVETM